MKQNKGFTLIELLVVIAIIGILSSVVLASLNSARGKGGDAAIKSNLANMRAQAELSYDNNGSSYSMVCGDSNILKGIASAKNASGITANNFSTTSSGTLTGGVAASLTTATCHATLNGYAIAVPLETVNLYACIDSTGQSTTTASLGANSVVCGQ